MTFATRMQSTALNLLTKYGRSVTLTRVTEGTYNPETSDTGVSFTTTFSGYGHPSPYSVQELDNELILLTDIKLLFYSTTVPSIGDTASIDNLSYRVMSVQKLNAQGQNIVYILQLRN